MKKTLAILLSLALVICMIPATASVAFATASASATLELTSDSVEYTGTAQTPGIKSVSVTPDTGNLVEGSIVVKWKNGESTAESTVSEAKVYTPVIEYKVDNTTETQRIELAAPTFTVKPYDLTNHKVRITVASQPEGVDSLTVKIEDVKIFADGSELIGEKRNIFTSNFSISTDTINKKVTLTNANRNFSGNLEGNYELVPNINDDTKFDFKVAENVVYDGTVKDLNKLVSVTKKGTYTSIGSSNYDVTCTKEVKDADTYNLTIKGKGDYAGEKTGLTLTVKEKDSKYLTISSVPTQVYGKINPTITVSDIINGKTVELRPAYDYNVSSAYQVGVKNNTTYTYAVDVLFTKNYTPNRKVEFDVVKQEYDVEGMQVYRGSTQLTGSTVLPGASMYRGITQPVTGITVYTDYANNKTLSTSYYDVVYEYTENGKTVSTTSPIDAKNYNVYIVGKNGYAGKKLIGTYKIPKFDIKNTTITVSAASATATPNVTVKSIYDNITFVKDKDYTVTSSSYVSNGKIWVTVTPKETGNLTGTARSDYYPVVAKSISSCRVYFTNGRSSASYTGSSIVVDVKVEDGYYNVLRERTDYTISYKLNGKEVYAIKDAGVYTIEIKGINGYTGTTSLTFTVVGTDISGYTVTLKESSVNATGYAQTPVILSVKKGVYSSLTSNDYTVTYQDATGKTVTSMSAPGTYKVVVTGKNGYSGSTYATFRIVGLPQTVTVNQDSYKVYTSSDSFKITAKATGDGTGFTYTSSNPAVASVSAAGYVTIHKVGRAVITVTTTGNKKYEPTSKDVTVKVYPSKAKISQKPSTDGKKAQMKVRWGYQDGVTKYQIRYSRDKNFKSGSYLTKTVKAHGKSYTTQSTTISNLKSGYTYYFKVRAVYTDPYTGDTYYGSWSPWRSAKTK